VTGGGRRGGGEGSTPEAGHDCHEEEAVAPLS
jgi:hypothetical protein